MKAEKLEHPEKIKFVLNGTTYYYTEAELWDYFSKLYAKNNLSFGEKGFKRMLAKLKKYDGNPFGELDDPEAEKPLHELLEMGVIPVVY